MDGNPGYFTTLASASRDLGKTVVSALDFDSPDVSSSYLPKGGKRKCSAVDRPIILKDGSSLVLGLGHSSNSCTTEESSIDLGLGFNPKKVSFGTLNPLNNTGKPNLDLELSLSLSTGPPESDVTTLKQGLVPYQQYSESLLSLAPSVQLVDEGSISSRWKIGPLVPPLQNNTSSSCSGLANQQQPQCKKTSVKTCRFEGGCSKGARGASGLCIAHGGGRRCQRDGCQKGAEGKTAFCKAHGGGRRCQHLGCTKSAEGRTDYCIAHGGGRRCSYEGCARASRGKSGLCIRHGGGKRCQVADCSKSAEGISGLCISHGGGKRCQHPECPKGAQGSTVFCKAHGGGKRCAWPEGCGKGAEGRTPFCKRHGGGKRCAWSEGCTKSVHGGTPFCVAHGGGKRCAWHEGCTKSARGRTSYCVRHGGGKRCKYEGCGKSAQGKTDFCKAHGGGMKCSWVEMVGPGFGGPVPVACDKFARGKSGLCASHMSGKEISESFEMVSTVQYSDCGTTSMGSIGYGHGLDHLNLPEGRVHGGGLMEMLRRGGTGNTNNNNNNNNNNNEESSGRLELGKGYDHMLPPHSWM